MYLKKKKITYINKVSYDNRDYPITSCLHLCVNVHQSHYKTCLKELI